MSDTLLELRLAEAARRKAAEEMEARQRRELEQEFERDFEARHGFALAGTDQANDVDEMRRLPATPHLDRRLQFEEAGLAEMFGLSVEEML